MNVLTQIQQKLSNNFKKYISSYKFQLLLCANNLTSWSVLKNEVPDTTIKGTILQLKHLLKVIDKKTDTKIDFNLDEKPLRMHCSHFLFWTIMCVFQDIMITERYKFIIGYKYPIWSTSLISKSTTPP